ncbi:hypothetical protein [Chryseobacterium daeguense]|uniref:hypothetical protein n=1 Tax=Chryseobacterium daeguense TaxID=412438 RepID=UPI000418F735|nr:hypothetical protein [Chryseobacterium daeguense]
MKKFLLLAAFGVAGFVSAKGNFETKNVKTKKATVVFQLCGITVTFYNSLGEVTGQQMYTSDQPNLNSCMAYQSGVIAGLRAQGYRVQQMSNDVN